jgi:hypothetical protein
MAEEIEVTRDVPPRTPVLEPVRERLGDIGSRVNWGAIWAGTMVALGMETLFALFGFFIGFDLFNVNAANPWNGMSIWTFAWYLVTAGWAGFFGAWCAARLSGFAIPRVGILHGITVWGISTVATLLVVVTGVFSLLRAGLAFAMTNPAAAGGNLTVSAQGAANSVSKFSGILWGGVLLGLLTAILGGWLGRRQLESAEIREAPGGRSRLAA